VELLQSNFGSSVVTTALLAGALRLGTEGGLPVVNEQGVEYGPVPYEFVALMRQ
jgi:hypothetical protein